MSRYETSLRARSVRRASWLVRDALQRLFPRAEGHPAALFITGCQRSGTTLLLEMLERDRRTKTFGEFSALNLRRPGSHIWEPRNARRYTIRMHPISEVADRIARCPQDFVVIKALVESQRLLELLDGVPGSRAAWSYRHYRDVAASNVAKFGANLNQINLAPIVAGNLAQWQAEWVPDDVRDVVSRHLRPDLSVADGAALFWFVRNRLVIDLKLADDPRVLLVPYESLVHQPQQWINRIYAHAGVTRSPVDLCAGVATTSVGKARSLALNPEIDQLCAELLGELRRLSARSRDGLPGTRSHHGAEPIRTSRDPAHRQ